MIITDVGWHNHFKEFAINVRYGDSPYSAGLKHSTSTGQQWNSGEGRDARRNGSCQTAFAMDGKGSTALIKIALIIPK